MGHGEPSLPAIPHNPKPKVYRPPVDGLGSGESTPPSRWDVKFIVGVLCLVMVLTLVVGVSLHLKEQQEAASPVKDQFIPTLGPVGTPQPGESRVERPSEAPMPLAPAVPIPSTDSAPRAPEQVSPPPPPLAAAVEPAPLTAAPAAADVPVPPAAAPVLPPADLAPAPPAMLAVPSAPDLAPPLPQDAATAPKVVEVAPAVPSAVVNDDELHNAIGNTGDTPVVEAKPEPVSGVDTPSADDLISVINK
jgi:hypothetical protein